MPDLQTELSTKVVDKIVPALPSVREYIINAIIDEPGITGAKLAQDKPDHIATPSIPAQVSTLFNMGVLRREVRTSSGNRPTYAYWIDDLEKLPNEQSGVFRPANRPHPTLWSTAEYILAYFMRNPGAPSYEAVRNRLSHMKMNSVSAAIRDLRADGSLKKGQQVRRPGEGGKASWTYTVQRITPGMKSRLLARDPSLAEYIDVIERKAHSAKPPITQAPEPPKMALPVDDAHLTAAIPKDDPEPKSWGAAIIEPAATPTWAGSRQEIARREPNARVEPLPPKPEPEERREPGVRIAITTERKQYVMKIAEARAVYAQLRELFEG